ncbi:MAG: hypothetical protein A3F67_07395 [Verrucomicrobia bacterium RIFCSPHIGHO2_12_FULL_41_10]|nr:MAG: hypothetical protein A3F67_07395 [Verrucomicrobia bacterium RIFCSPHIGHO2_12_FULL_41_10]HLB33117.1 hypothetical protein [Chthoniobacterales bacterium]
MKTKTISHTLLASLFLGLLIQSSMQADFLNDIAGKANQVQDVIGKVNDAKNTNRYNDGYRRRRNYDRYQNAYRRNQDQDYQDFKDYKDYQRYQNNRNYNYQNSNGNSVEEFFRNW